MNTNTYLKPLDVPATKDLPKTFMVWELTALYRRLGLVPRAAEHAAVADLRMLFEHPPVSQEAAA